jgi:hypothetical protein
MEVVGKKGDLGDRDRSGAAGNVIRNESRVHPHAADERRAQAVLEPQADEVQPFDVGRYPAAVPRISIGIQHRHLDPAVVGLEAGAPHDRARLDHVTSADRQSASLVDDSADAHDPGLSECPIGDTDTLIAATPRSVSHPAPEPRVRGRV